MVGGIQRDPDVADSRGWLFLLPAAQEGGSFFGDGGCIWGDRLRRDGAEYDAANAAQMTNAQANAAALRRATHLQAAMLAELTRENVERGARLGGPNAAANVYALHNLGQ